MLIPLGVKCVPHSIGRVALPRTVHNHLRKRIGETYKKKKKIKKREKYHRAKLADDFMRKTCMEAAPIQKNLAWQKRAKVSLSELSRQRQRDLSRQNFTKRFGFHCRRAWPCGWWAHKSGCRQLDKTRRVQWKMPLLIIIKLSVSGGIKLCMYWDRIKNRTWCFNTFFCAEDDGAEDIVYFQGIVFRKPFTSVQMMCRRLVKGEFLLLNFWLKFLSSYKKEKQCLNTSK